MNEIEDGRSPIFFLDSSPLTGAQNDKKGSPNGDSNDKGSFMGLRMTEGIPTGLGKGSQGGSDRQRGDERRK